MDKNWLDIYHDFDEIGANLFNLSYSERRRFINKYRLLGVSKSLVLSVLSTIIEDCKNDQSISSCSFFNASYLYHEIQNNKFKFNLFYRKKN